MPGPYGTNANWNICFRDTGTACPRTTLWEICSRGIAKKKAVYGSDEATEIKPGLKMTNIGGSEYVFLAIYVCSAGGII